MAGLHRLLLSLPLFLHSLALSPAKAAGFASVSVARRQGIASPLSARLMERERQVLLREGSGPHSGATNGSIWPVAIYWTKIAIGTPPKMFPVAIDSGSGDLDIQGPNCANCPKDYPNNVYNPSESTTSKHIFPYYFSNTYQTCDLSDPSAPCTISGKLFADSVSFADIDAVQVKLGAITKQTSNFNQFQDICGVMGLLGSSTSNVFQSMVKAGVVESNVWAICLSQGSEGNGTLTFGGIDERLYNGTVGYTPNTGGMFYAMELSGGVQINGVPVDSTVGQKEAILDSGTNVLLLPTSDFQNTKKVFLNSCDPNNNWHGVCDVDADATLFDNKCFEFSEEQIAAFPIITIAAKGVNLTMHGADYLLPSDPRAKSSKELCLGIRPSSAGLFIVGDNTMQNYYVVFDNEKQQIGWAPVNAKACGSV
mmetsp:Transcript_15712/g.38754  ORF Transcript_15712/g.38754 Transcript_15712/m.38754 type:complete len:424 (+) Transcript_15712:41-1312(+)